MTSADLMNAWLIRIAGLTWHAAKRSVLTHVIVQSMLIAHQGTTEEFAHVKLVLLAILMALDVIQVSILLRKYLNFGLSIIPLLWFLVPVPKPDCTEDSHCPSQLACIEEKCVNPCTAIAPCAENAECKVYDTTPLRTMSCTCIPGFTGNGYRECNRIVEEVKVGCSSDFECLDSEACQSGDCRNPCYTNNPCSSTAICTATNHKANCKCPPGFEGDPYRQCARSKFNRVLVLRVCS